MGKLDKKISKLLVELKKLKKTNKKKTKLVKRRVKRVKEPSVDKVAEFTKNQLFNTVRPSHQNSLIAQDAKRGLETIQEEARQNNVKKFEDFKAKTGDKIQEMNQKVIENSRTLSNLENIARSYLNDVDKVQNPRSFRWAEPDEVEEVDDDYVKAVEKQAQQANQKALEFKSAEEQLVLQLGDIDQQIEQAEQKDDVEAVAQLKAEAEVLEQERFMAEQEHKEAEKQAKIAARIAKMVATKARNKQEKEETKKRQQEAAKVARAGK